MKNFFERITEGMQVYLVDPDWQNYDIYESFPRYTPATIKKIRTNPALVKYREITLEADGKEELFTTIDANNSNNWIVGCYDCPCDWEAICETENDVKAFIKYECNVRIGAETKEIDRLNKKIEKANKNIEFLRITSEGPIFNITKNENDPTASI